MMTNKKTAPGVNPGATGQAIAQGLGQAQIVQSGAATPAVEPIAQPIQEAIAPESGQQAESAAKPGGSSSSPEPANAYSPEQAAKQFGTPAQPTQGGMLLQLSTVLPMPESGRNVHQQDNSQPGKVVSSLPPSDESLPTSPTVKEGLSGIRFHPQVDDAHSESAAGALQARSKQPSSSLQAASPALKKTGVTFRVMHGDGSATSLHSIGKESANSDKYLPIFYIGDWDPSGMNMSEIDIPGRMQRYDGDFTIERIALDAGDAGPGTKLPSFDVQSKVGDSRHRWFVDNYGARCWELDALSPVVLRQRVETAILGCLDQDAWDHSVDVEKAERESMSGFMDTWTSISGPAKKYSLDAAEGGV
jgi:hypothetical protein